MAAYVEVEFSTLLDLLERKERAAEEEDYDELRSILLALDQALADPRLLTVTRSVKGERSLSGLKRGPFPHSVIVGPFSGEPKPGEPWVILMESVGSGPDVATYQCKFGSAEYWITIDRSDVGRAR